MSDEQRIFYRRKRRKQRFQIPTLRYLRYLLFKKSYVPSVTPGALEILKAIREVT
jgi:hypothetical protein